MTNNELIELYSNLSALTSLKGAKFNYAVAKNISLLKPEVEAIRSSVKHTELFEAYEKERIALCEKHAKKDENKNPIKESNNYVIDDLKAFSEALKSLQEVHKEAMTEQEKQLADLETLLKAENTIELYKISLSDVPDEITTVQMNALYPIISEA